MMKYRDWNIEKGERKIHFSRFIIPHSPLTGCPIINQKSTIKLGD